MTARSSMEKPTPKPSGPHRQGGEGARRADGLKPALASCCRRGSGEQGLFANKAKQTVEVA